LRLLAVLLLLAQPALSQDMAEAPGGMLRVLDKLGGEVADLDMARGQTATMGRLTLLLDSCRYPADDPASDAMAHLTISDSVAASPVFSGWMVASSPALSALDHPRYDVWVLRCDYPEAPPPEPVEGE